MHWGSCAGQCWLGGGTGIHTCRRHEGQTLCFASCYGTAGHVSWPPDSSSTQEYNTCPWRIPQISTWPVLRGHHRHTHAFSPRPIPQNADTRHEDPLHTCAPTMHTLGRAPRIQSHGPQAVSEGLLGELTSANITPNCRDQLLVPPDGATCGARVC